ncbi:hypothetical protein ADIS_1610 [Lunatimonas lonarensis]|uniref:Uncharacterized protein n=1 Tax=Lunatimonas lonarensis TaxID=1232681 RepID=R7ZUY8_9BACT|nr:hypothetical protein [Lunatimonas lonarensis]EON77897.1 hypothetical protein ADIS_1610 [Lunatimonas lonarensis]
MRSNLATSIDDNGNSLNPGLFLDKEEMEREVLSAGEALERQGVRLLGRQAADRGNYSEVTFELSERFQSLYGVLRGLSELYRSPVAYIRSNHSYHNFTLHFKAEAKQEVKAFLELVFTVLEKEIHFKKVLHKVISIQRKHEQENELLYKQLY